MVGHFALAAHCPGAGAAVSGGDGGAVRILAVHPHRQILLCRHACCHPISLVWLLLSDAVPSASMRVRRALAGKAGKLPAAKMDELSLYPHSAASAAGADERSSPAGLCLPGGRGRVARHRPRLWRGLFCRHGLYRTGDGDGDRDDAPQMPHPAYKDHAGAAICAGRAGGAVFRALYQPDPLNRTAGRRHDRRAVFAPCRRDRELHPLRAHPVEHRRYSESGKRAESAKTEAGRTDAAL